MIFLNKTALALIAMTAASYAADDPFSKYYSNTLVYTNADKTVDKVYPEKDGTWKSTSTDTKQPTNSGKWARLDSWLCSTAMSAPKSKPWCRKAEGHNIGDKWTEVQPDKTTSEITLVAGR